MLCDNPYMAGAIPLGCGQCAHCRLKRARLWSWRQFFESLGHEHNCFVTLTYDDEHLPKSGDLEPRVVQLWLKRLRKAIRPLSFRYFLVGEYGSTSRRPHYHLSMFGVSQFTTVNGQSFSDIVRQTWGRGFIYVAEFNERTAIYVTGYVSKHLADKQKNVVWSVPEYARFSLRPGLGFFSMSVVARSLISQRDNVLRGRDVPNQLRVAKRRPQLGRYLLNALREQTGFAPDYAKKFRDNLSYEKSLEMCALRQNSEDVQTFKEAYLEATRQARNSQLAKAKIFGKVAVL